MLRVTLNGEPRPLGAIPERWEQLLDAIDSEASARQEVVASVRFNGLDDPAFRDAAARDLRLDTMSLIEVSTVRPEALLAEALAQASSTARDMMARAADAAADFRGGRLEQANAGLREFTGGVGLLMATLTAVAAARASSLDRLAWNGQPLSTHAQSLAGPLQAIIDAHESQDWLTVADVLEFDAQATLETWPAMFASLDLPQADA